MGAFPYQLIGAEHLASQDRAYLGDRPGLGKTIQTLLACNAVQARTVLVVCPASMVGTWREEIAIWYEGSPQQFDVVSYDKFIRRPTPSYFPHVVVFDEAHYLKNATAQRTMKTYGSSWLDAVEHVWMLSGTPMPNGTHEMYTAAKFSGLVNISYRQWMNRYCQWYQGEYGPRVVGAQNVDQFRALMQGFLLRRTFEDVDLELPERDVRRWPVTMQAASRRELEAALDALPSEVLDQIERGELPTQSPHTSTLRRVLGVAKATPVAKALVDELKDNNEQYVVFAYHKVVMDMLEQEFKRAKLATVRLDGSTSGVKRDQARSLFQLGAARVFLGQLTAAGTGITLTAANQVIIVEPSWVPSDNDQAISRCQRIGQTHNTVYVRVATLPGSLDDPIMGTVISKERTLNSVY